MIRKIIRKLLRYLSKKDIKQRTYAIGITSKIGEDRHIVILDYDTLNLQFVLYDLKELCDFFNLSEYEIYETKKGFHVFFWYEDIPYSRLKMIINFSRCDESFKYISRFYEWKTVRCSGKYKIKDIHYIGKFKGKRTPKKEERELGELKRKEYLLLKNQKILKDEVLK